MPASSYHPTKSYPVLVGVGNVPYACPYVTCFLPSPFGNVPLSGLNVTLYWLAVQCAYKVSSFVGIYGDSIFVPPTDCVYHPSNVYPCLVAVGKFILLSVYSAVIVSSFVPNVYCVPLIVPIPCVVHCLNVFVWITCCFVPVPSFESNATLYPFGATGLLISVVVLYAPFTVELLVTPFHVPPFGFTINVYSTSFHCAYSVIADVGK